MCIIEQDTLHKHVGQRVTYAHIQKPKMQRARTLPKEFKRAHTLHARGSAQIGIYTRAIHISFIRYHPHIPCALVMSISRVCTCTCACLPASESLNALMTTVLTQVF